jgi:hypothetical protein
VCPGHATLGNAGVVVASVERTAYPRFKRIISDRELMQFFTPDEAEIAWAAKRTHRRPESLLTLLVLLKSCARLGYFPGPPRTHARRQQRDADHQWRHSPSVITS